MRYLVFDRGNFEEFTSWNDAEYFMLDKPNARCKKITSKKAEEDFRKNCLSMPEMKQKIYIVIVDGQVKRFESWNNGAKEFIARNPGAKYKSFYEESEAQEFANLNIHNKISEDSLFCELATKGAVILSKNGSQEVIGNINVQNPIEAELNAAILGIKKAIELKEEQIVIKYKNLGTEMWANGTWKTNKEFSINYKNQIAELKKKINIDFLKIA